MSASDTALRLVSAAVIASLKSGMSPETPVVSISIICSNFFLLSSEGLWGIECWVDRSCRSRVDLGSISTRGG